MNNFVMSCRRLPKKHMKGHFDEQEREEMRKFADSVIPRNWNVFTNYENFKETKLTLNIHLDIRNADEEKNMNYHACVHGGMTYFNGFASVHVVLQPTMMNWKDLILHEFAHVAEYRYFGFKKRAKIRTKYYQGDLILLPYKNPHRSKAFKKATRTLANKACLCADYK